MKRIERKVSTDNGMVVRGALVEVVKAGTKEQVDIFDGHDCTEGQHVKEHTVVMNPVVTNSKGRIVFCVPEGDYDMIISGTGLEETRRSLDEE